MSGPKIGIFISLLSAGVEQKSRLQIDAGSINCHFEPVQIDPNLRCNRPAFLQFLTMNETFTRFILRYEKTEADVGNFWSRACRNVADQSTFDQSPGPARKRFIGVQHTACGAGDHVAEFMLRLSL